MDFLKHGLAVGKFYPPHAGHHWLIDQASADCNKLTVAVCYSSVENIPVEQRIEWLKDRHPQAHIEFIAVKDDTPVLYTDETWGWFLDALMEALDARWNPYLVDEPTYPNHIYSGEAYAKTEFAPRLLAEYDKRVFRDAFPREIGATVYDRSINPISATLFRERPHKHWELLAPATRAGLTKRVVICGAESTGTTTLAKDLAREFETTVVPEYGRHFDWAVGKHHTWKTEDFLHIANRQKLWEDDLARESRNGVLVCDTDEYATAMFHEIYLGEEAPLIVEKAAMTPADLYIVTDHEGVDFVDDGTRYNSHKREWGTNWLLNNLPDALLVTGDRDQRLRQAITAVMLTREWDIATPIEYRQ